MKNILVTLPDGSQRSIAADSTVQDVAKSIGRRLEEDAVAGKVDGKLVDLGFPLKADAQLSILTRNTKEGLEVIRHSTAHLLAHALKELYPGTQISIGPVIEDGFYYDIDCPQKLTPEDLPKIEKRMEEIAARKLPVSRQEFTKTEAIAFFKDRHENYKTEIIEGSPDDRISAYWHGSEFVDLCRGPHIPHTGKGGKFKLLSIAGAYWRGDEKNKMLQRIYGTAFATQKELDEHLNRLEEAKKRDHRKLGPELGLFTFLPVAPAMPFYLPKGTTLFNLLTDFMRREVLERGYQEVICPQLMSAELWKTSGHWDHYRENMFVIEDAEGKDMALKPMNCPGHCNLYGSTKHSYRELPLRFAEFTKLYRNERAGVTHGLLRTRAFSQDDAHIFCTEEQIGAEAEACIEHTDRIYRLFGFNEVVLKLATRPDSFIGTAEKYDRASEILAESLTKLGKKFEIAPKEGAFYGPKIEFHIKDSLGRFWQCGTVQLDYGLPERFELEYVGNDSSAKRPAMIHRAILGSLERFMGILIEHHAGHLPLWINPVQAVVINVTDDQLSYAQSLTTTMQKWGMRVETDFRNEKLGYRIREAQLKKVPMMIVIGNSEKESGTVSVRKVTGENLNGLTLDKFEEFIKSELTVT